MTALYNKNQPRPSDALLKLALLVMATLALFGAAVFALDAIYNGVG